MLRKEPTVELATSTRSANARNRRCLNVNLYFQTPANVLVSFHRRRSRVPQRVLSISLQAPDVIDQDRADGNVLRASIEQHTKHTSSEHIDVATYVYNTCATYF
jgi:hypothetical protein